MALESSDRRSFAAEAIVEFVQGECEDVGLDVDAQSLACRCHNVVSGMIDLLAERWLSLWLDGPFAQKRKSVFDIDCAHLAAE
jgi:hypothetical protein